MVHEAGHLLLGVHSHAEAGIMKARWDDHGLQAMAQHAVGFTDEQTRELRVRLAARLGLDKSVGDDPESAPCTANQAAR